MGRRSTWSSVVSLALFSLLVPVVMIEAPTTARAAEPAPRGVGPAVGTAIQDRATLTGTVRPTGTIAFALYSDPASCRIAVFNDLETLAADGTATSKFYVPTVAGTYQWVASYSGDVNNNAVAGACPDSREQVTVAPAGSDPTGPGNPGGPGGFHGPGGDGVWWIDPCPCWFDEHHRHHHWGQHHRHHRHGHRWWSHHRHHRPAGR